MNYNPNMLVSVGNETQISAFLTNRTVNFWIKGGFIFTPVDRPDCGSDLIWDHISTQLNKIYSKDLFLQLHCMLKQENDQ